MAGRFFLEALAALKLHVPHSSMGANSEMLHPALVWISFSTHHSIHQYYPYVFSKKLTFPLEERWRYFHWTKLNKRLNIFFRSFLVLLAYMGMILLGNPVVASQPSKKIMLIQQSYCWISDWVRNSKCGTENPGTDVFAAKLGIGAFR